ncbi:DUF6278 family protein [Mycobacterium deserti]|uniref:DUF6278 family protein n=1 Tax=Mycobacterium deserti TaxID=2978347 RepID=A0ABT2MGI7_9MYCO|nr:DUF6278 family protein [Mycobacterium deserti]MCT7661382.1 DUF6278 family protein [Mycobacterium deserti]
MWKRGRNKSDEPKAPVEVADVATMRAGAEALVAASAGSDWPLDWTPPSVRTLDGFVSGISEEDFSAAFTTVAGYFGELIVRNGGGQWVDGPDGWPQVRMPSGFELRPAHAVAEARSMLGPALESVYVHAMAGFAVPDDEQAAAFGDEVGQRMAVWAALFLHEVAVSGRRLDWTIESLAQVDELCDDFLADQPDAEAIDQTALTMGAYLGEVLIRACDGAQWMLSTDHRDVAVRLPRPGGADPESTTCFPAAFVGKRLTEDTTPSLQEYATMAVSGDVATGR